MDLLLYQHKSKLDTKVYSETQFSFSKKINCVYINQFYPNKEAHIITALFLTMESPQAPSHLTLYSSRNSDKHLEHHLLGCDKSLHQLAATQNTTQLSSQFSKY